jgi:hypothetical protein
LCGVSTSLDEMKPIRRNQSPFQLGSIIKGQADPEAASITLAEFSQGRSAMRLVAPYQGGF